MNLLFLFLFFSLFLLSSLSCNRRRRLLRVGVRPDPPLKPFTNGSDIYISYTSFLRGFINTQGLFNRTAPIPGNLTYAAFMDVVAADGSIKSRNELSAFVAISLVASKGFTRPRDPNISFSEDLTRSYYRRGYLGIEGLQMYTEASIDLFNDQRLLEAPELVLQNESNNWLASLWNWKRLLRLENYNLQRDFHNITEAFLGSKSCETVYKVYTILKQEWDPKKIENSHNALIYLSFICYDPSLMLSSQCIEKLEIIGSGSFGRVFKCRDLRTGEFVAVKEIDLDKDNGDCFDELRAEISTLMTCDHSNIIRYRGSYVPNTISRGSELCSPLSNRLCIVMDYCERGSLRQVLDQHGPLPEPLISEIAESILKALEYLHRQGISHRDLKGANVLVDARGNVKLGDFGVAFQREDQENDNRIVGSPYWMAPEVLNPSDSINSRCDASKADIWSFGITLIELLRGRPPLYYLSPRAAMATIPRTSPPRLESDDPRASKTLRNLIHSCLHDDPRKRPSASQLLKSFKSYFKQQKSSLIPGSLSRLNLKNPENVNLNHNSSARITNATVSETIYSQWDFDLTKTEFESLERESVVTETRSETIESTEKTGVESTGATIKTATNTLIPSPIKVHNLNTNTANTTITTNTTNTTNTAITTVPLLSPTKPQTPTTSSTYSFRKLRIRSESRGSGWDNKDISILPIPCPSDAPNLTKLQN